MISSVEDILLLASVILLIAGIFGVFLRPIRQGLKVIHEKFRLRHLFIGSLLCFALSLTFGWEDFKAGLNGKVCAISSTGETEVRHSEDAGGEP